ncbi:hypothetical protein NFI96_002149 [Prochilodus magdalenae]|nr:hypothetical protein NFI96_002149 [Prochilodus magdalenae]
MSDITETTALTRPLTSSKRHKSVRKSTRRIYSPYQDNTGPSDDEDKDEERVDCNDPEELFQNIQVQKELIANIRTRPWPIRRKLKVLNDVASIQKPVQSMLVLVEVLQAIRQAREIVLKYEGRLTRTRGYQAAGADLEHPHTVPADGAVGVEVEGHQAFWTCDDKPFILVLTTVPPHTDSLGVSTKTKAGLVTEDDPLPF